MSKFGFDELPLGFIIGEANLTDVKKYDSKEDLLKDKNLHLADENWGKHGFILENVKRIEPISAKGKLNFWDFELK